MTHCSRKGRKGTSRVPQAKVKKVEGTLGSKRKAPMITESRAPGPSKQRRRRKEVVDESLTSHARRVTHTYPPSGAAVLRLNRKLERKKDEQRLEQEQRQAKGRKEPQLPSTSSTFGHGPQHLDEKRQQQLHDDKAKDERKHDADRRVPVKRKANGNARTGDKAQEDEAIKRIMKKQVSEPPQAPQEESDDEELIEACWQDLVMNDASREIQDRSKDELVDESMKKPRLDEPDFDHDPKLPGSCGTTAAIKARLWSEMRGRPSVDRHTACQEGKQSENLAWRTRGTTSERASKFQRGTAGRIQIDATLAIDRLLKHSAASASSRPLRNVNGVSCSSEEGSGRHVKKPPT